MAEQSPTLVPGDETGHVALALDSTGQVIAWNQPVQLGRAPIDAVQGVENLIKLHPPSEASHFALLDPSQHDDFFIWFNWGCEVAPDQVITPHPQVSNQVFWRDPKFYQSSEDSYVSARVKLTDDANTKLSTHIKTELGTGFDRLGKAGLRGMNAEREYLSLLVAWLEGLETPTDEQRADTPHQIARLESLNTKVTTLVGHNYRAQASYWNLVNQEENSDYATLIANLEKNNWVKGQIGKVWVVEGLYKRDKTPAHYAHQEDLLAIAAYHIRAIGNSTFSDHASQYAAYLAKWPLLANFLNLQ